MALKAKKLLITTEKHEVLIVRGNTRTTIRGFCPRCGTEVEMLTLDFAVSISGIGGIGGRQVIRELASEEIHSLETANGHLLVCQNSLNNSLTQNNRKESI